MENDTVLNNIRNLNTKPSFDVSIILATKDRAALLDKMLASLKTAVQGITCELIVIEGASNDNTLDVLHKHGVKNVYSEAQCLGPGRHSWPQLYNFGFSKAHGKWAMYASDDILFSKGCISRAVKMLNEQKDEVAGGIFFYKNTHTRPDWDKFGIDFTLGPKLLMNYGLVRLEHFRAVGGLDEAYRFYCADGDLCFKLYEAGWQFIPLPGCFVVHDNVLDAAKQTNADNSNRDIELYIQRWKHFVSPERPEPRRLLWHADFAEAFNLPASLPKIDSAIEHFWHGLACFQYSMFERAKLNFLQALQSACDHWLVLWYLAKTAYKCGDRPLAEKAARAVLQLEPGFPQAKDLLTRLGSDPEQAPKPMSTRIENDADTSTVCDDVLKNIKVHNDSTVFDDVGFDNSDCQTNGEFALLRCLIKPGDVVFDIGANTGRWSRRVLSDVGRVRLHSFEPVTNTFAVLKSNLGRSGALLHNIAISGNNGSETFYHYNKTSKLAHMSSFYRRNPAVEQQFNMEPVPISVQAQTLDSFCEKHSISRVDFVKIDTEGAELDVLRGAANLLREHRIKIIQFEYGGTYPDAGITLQQVCRLLSSHDCAIFRILPDSLVHITNWRDSLENNRYSNYLAVSASVAGDYTIMQNLHAQKTLPRHDIEVEVNAPAPFLVRPETDVLSQLKDGRLWSEGKPLRLHLGCGKWHFDEYINIDYPPKEHNVVTHLGADLYADITKLNFPAHSVDEIRLHHVFEHFDRVTALGLLVTWHEWLKVGGRLHIETPDLIGSAKTLLSDASLKTKMGVVRHLAGDQADKWAYHTDHWFGQRFEHTLTQLGFGPVRVRTSSWPHEPYLSNVQVEAAKQVHLTRQQLLAACDKLLLDSLVADAPNELAKHGIWMRRLRTFLDETAASYSEAGHTVDEAVAPNKEPSARNDVETETVGLIFSKDRPMQLAATIESFALHCLDNANPSGPSGGTDGLDGIKLNVLYKTSNEQYRTQYDTLKNEFADITFIEETDFKAQTLAVLGKHEYVLFLVDDNLFVRDFSLAEIVGLLKQNHNALAFSLRLGPNTTYSYARDAQVTLPQFWYVDKSVLKYDWTRAHIHFAYPLELSSSVYRAADIIPMLKKLDFDNPNILEGLMAANTQVYARPRGALLCYEQSVTFCNPINMVQTVCENRAGSLSRYSADSLAQMFDRGLRIDVQRYSGFVPHSPHQEVELEFVKPGSDSRGDEPLVSVEMIAYNAEKFIAAAIDSVLAQTYKNLELLIIDDGSGDRTKEIIDSYSDGRIRYIQKPHKNRWSGTNVAIAQASGQYIISVDSDDFIAPDYIEKMVACARRYPDIDYFYPSDLTLVDQFGNPTGGRWDYVDFSDNTILPKFLFDNAYSPVPHPGSLKRKSLYQRVGGYQELENAADFVFLCRNALKMNFKRVEEHSAYFYRLLSSSLSHKFEARNQITADILNEMVSIYPPEVLCPRIAAITEPALRQQQYYKYLMETFYRHVHGHMVKYGDYFRRYGDYYKQQLLNCATAVTKNNASPTLSCDYAGHQRSLICRR
jgi:FkbM family methyltransferase